MPQVDTEKHTRISKTKVKKFETAKSLFPTVPLQVGTPPAPLTMNRGRGQRIGRVPSLQENCFFATTPAFFPCPFSMLQQIQITAPCPVSSETGVFLQRYTSVSSIFFKFPLSFFILRNKKANESFSSAAPFGRKKISHSPVCDSIFLGLSGQIFSDVRSRPTKILKISAFRDFLSPVQRAKKGQKPG